MFNLAVPEAREYLTRYLDASIKEYGISCLRIDNAVSYRDIWEALDRAEPDRRGMAEIRYVEGLYRLWDDLLAANPSVFIDNCASGGGRVDLETCARSIPLWRADATIDPLLKKDFNRVAIQNQVMTAGLNRYVPFSTCGQIGATPYYFRSGLNGGGICFCDDVRGASYPRDLLKQATAEAKRLRPYFFGDFYVLGDVTARPEDWCVTQYHRPREQDGMVLAFRREKATGADLSVNLHEIDPDADYEITRAYDYERPASTRVGGAELRALKLHIEECPGSLVVEYRKAKP
jgi:alpha-galactosidase